MATPNTYSIQLITTLLEGSTTVLSSPGSASTGTLTEAFYGFPHRIPGNTSNLNVKLGLLSDPKWLALFGDDGVSLRLSLTGTVINASPFAFLADVQDGLGISEIWVSNNEADEKTFMILAAE